MSQDCNLARVAWAMTPCQTHTHTQICSPGRLCNPCTSCLLCLPIFHDQFILSACSFPSCPTATCLLPSAFPLPPVTYSFHPCLSSCFLFFPPLTSDTLFLSHLPSSPRCQLFHTIATLWPSISSLFVRMRPSSATGSFSKPFLFFPLLSMSPCRLLYPSSSPLFL